MISMRRMQQSNKKVIPEKNQVFYMKLNAKKVIALVHEKTMTFKYPAGIFVHNNLIPSIIKLTVFEKKKYY
jgi:predicted ribosome-associated RNA-binding protein Tma20